MISKDKRPKAAASPPAKGCPALGSAWYRNAAKMTGIRRRGTMQEKRELPACPVETTLMLIGDKWKVLILRDLMLGTKRFGE